MTEENKEPKKLTPEEFEEKRAELSAALKKAQQDLWDHSHPVIEDPQIKAQTEYRKSLAEEQKKSTKKAE